MPSRAITARLTRGVVRLDPPAVAAVQEGRHPLRAISCELGANIIVASASFVVPMWGIHGRLVREKEELLREAERRANALAVELYARIDAGKCDSTAVINSLTRVISDHI